MFALPVGDGDGKVREVDAGAERLAGACGAGASTDNEHECQNCTASQVAILRA